MRPRRRDDFAIAIICALVFEADAVEALFDETYDRLGKHYGKERGDANTYVNGRIGKHDVVLCYMPGMGKGSAAGVASSLLISYPGVRLALVVGICGGAPSPPKYQEIYLGDVIISDSTHWAGQIERSGLFSMTFARKKPAVNLKTRRNTISTAFNKQEPDAVIREPMIFFSRPAIFISIIARLLLMDAAPVLEDHEIRGREASEPYPVSIYIGPVASADTVMKSGQHRDEIASTEKVLGFEMEGAGVWDHVPCIIIKGVCDYADSHKNKVWQEYAAATGASVAKTFLEYWRPADHRDASGNYHVIIPFAKNPYFVGRQQEIQMIEDSITMPDGPRKLAITGLGGVGKTQIALEIAYCMRHRDPECSIFWIPCTSFEAVEQAFVTIAQVLGLREVQPTKVKECLRAHFSQSNKKWILIFDNADDKDMWMEIQGSSTAPRLKNIIPQSDNGRVLFTSRNRQLALKLAPSNVVSIPHVDQKAGKEILMNLLICKDLLRDDYETNTLLEMLSCLPLAISQAAAYINRNDISLATYMSLLGEQEGASIELLSEEFDDDGRYEASQHAVAATWPISFVQIQQRDKIASDFLSFMACISHREIPESILPHTESAKARVEALGLLKACSFVSAQVENSMKYGTFTSWVGTTADRLSTVFPDEDHCNRQTWRNYLPHALYLADSAEFQERQHDYDNFLARIGRCLRRDGRYAEAGSVFRNVLSTQERFCGPEHADTLASIRNLGLCLERQGNYEEAEAIHRRALLGSEKVLGPEHPHTLIRINDFGSILAHQSKYKEVETMHRRSLSGSEKVFGPEHPRTLNSMAILASMLFDQGRFVEAEELAVQLLGARKRMPGPEHPWTLTSMRNLACTWRKLGRTSDASILLKDCVDLSNKALGSHHADTAQLFNILLSWETNSKPASTDASTPPLAHTHESEMMPDSKLGGRKWRRPMNFLFQRRR
ncbi:kinesin light chain [Penicillium diatomitis]|uniref:Kinesin light chain n=1 Tax=Penicillium diatomitis TaxID=2819901 RepID=A0A9W9X2L6_9EURO|nr:kinesin light chain [Penicillium diatomitis]KAJ5481007.1 kinesin light chain [Penicillium diatomitis]